MDESQKNQPQEKPQNRVKKSLDEILAKEKKELDELKNKIQKKESRYNQRLRKERNGQLIALGVLVEMLYKVADSAARSKWLKQAGTVLKDRNLERVVAAFTRLDKEAPPSGQASPQPDGQD